MYGDWYARHIYLEGSDQYLHHWRIYGHPSKVGYKDIVPLWKAERFDPEGLMDLYVEAGAKYFFGQAAHHDNFDNWNSAHNRWNAVKLGPKKNIVKMWQDAAKRRGLPFGLSEHLGATFSWFCLNKGCDKAGPYAGVPYDGNDPAYEDLYLPNGEELKNEKRPWLTKNPWWHERWFRRVKDIIDRHHPDLLYSDSEVPFGEVGLHAIAHLYNTSAKLHGGVNQAVYNQKDRNPEVYPVGVLDIERGGEADIFPQPWQTDTSVGDWFYNVRDRYKTPKHCVEMLVDIVSKNGNLLLNFPQRPDGTLDDECLYILKCMAKWIKVHGEGIYETRPWKKAQEGPTTPEGGAFKEDARAWTSEDYRFTAKGDKVYAFLLKWPEEGKALIKSFGRNTGPEVVNVNLLGFDGQVKYTQDDAGLHITLPATQTDRKSVE
jgi:alpha-L-fucosidase